MLNIKTQSSRFESELKSDLKKQLVEETKEQPQEESPEPKNFRSDNKVHNNASFNFSKFNELSTEIGDSTRKQESIPNVVT